MPYDQKFAESFQIDDLDFNIIKELMNDPDARSASIAAKYRKPLSTVQRRRCRLEKSILAKRYSVRFGSLGKRNGTRSGYLFAKVEKGVLNKTAELLMKNPSVYTVTAGLNSNINLVIHVWYRSSQDLLEITESLKSIPNVTSVEWFEEVESFGYNTSAVLAALPIGR